MISGPLGGFLGLIFKFTNDYAFSIIIFFGNFTLLTLYSWIICSLTVTKKSTLDKNNL